MPFFLWNWNYRRYLSTTLEKDAVLSPDLFFILAINSRVVKMPTAEINGIRMNYDVIGDGEPVLLVTGFGGDINFFHSLYPFMEGKYKLIVFDNRGVGSTEFHGDFGCQDLVDDIEALLDYLKIEKVHLLGWSLGSQISMEFALQHQEMVHTLTLISAFKFVPARSSYMMNSIIDLCAKYDLPVEFVIEATNIFSMTEKYFIMKREKGQKMKRVNNSTTGNLRLQMNCLDTYDLRGRLGALKMPVLSIHGLDDIMVEPKMGDDIVKDLPQAEAVRVPDAGHIIHPSMYAEQLIAFLKKHPM